MIQFTTEEKGKLAELFIAHLTNNQAEQLFHELKRNKEIGYNKDGFCLDIKIIYHNFETLWAIPSDDGGQQVSI